MLYLSFLKLFYKLSNATCLNKFVHSIKRKETKCLIIIRISGEITNIWAVFDKNRLILSSNFINSWSFLFVLVTSFSLSISLRFIDLCTVEEERRGEERRWLVDKKMLKTTSKSVKFSIERQKVKAFLCSTIINPVSDKKRPRGHLRLWKGFESSSTPQTAAFPFL